MNDKQCFAVKKRACGAFLMCFRGKEEKAIESEASLKESIGFLTMSGKEPSITDFLILSFVLEAEKYPRAKRILDGSSTISRDTISFDSVPKTASKEFKEETKEERVDEEEKVFRRNSALSVIAAVTATLAFVWYKGIIRIESK